MGKFYFQLKKSNDFDAFNTFKARMIELEIAKETSFKENIQHVGDEKFVYQIFTFEPESGFHIATVNHSTEKGTLYLVHHGIYGTVYELYYNAKEIAWSSANGGATRGTKFEVFPQKLSRSSKKTPPSNKNLPPLPPITVLPECITQLLNRFSDEALDLLKASLEEATRWSDIQNSFYDFNAITEITISETNDLNRFLLTLDHEINVIEVKNLIISYSLPQPVLKMPSTPSNVQKATEEVPPELQLDENIIVQLDKIKDPTNRFKFLQRIDANTLKSLLERDKKTFANILYKLDNDNKQRLELFLKYANVIITDAKSLGQTLKAIGSDGGTEEEVKTALAHVENRLKRIEGISSDAIPAILDNIRDEVKNYFLEEILEPSMLKGLPLENFLHLLPQPRINHIIKALSNGASIHDPSFFAYYMNEETPLDQSKMIEFLLNPKVRLNIPAEFIPALLSSEEKSYFIQTLLTEIGKESEKRPELCQPDQQDLEDLMNELQKLKQQPTPPSTSSSWLSFSHSSSNKPNINHRFLVELEALIKKKHPETTFASCITEAYKKSGCKNNVITDSVEAFLEKLTLLDQTVNLSPPRPPSF